MTAWTSGHRTKRVVTGSLKQPWNGVIPSHDKGNFFLTPYTSVDARSYDLSYDNGSHKLSDIDRTRAGKV